MFVGYRTISEEDISTDDEQHLNNLGISDISTEFHYGGVSRAGGYS